MFAAGPCPCFIQSFVLKGGIQSFVLKGGKTLENGKVSYVGSIRHVDPALCPHGSLGQHLICRFTLDSEPFPDPEDAHDWVHTPMWPAGDSSRNMSYSQQADQINHYLRDCLGIFVKKVTHIFRVLGARLLDEQGVDDRVSAWLP